MATCLGLYIENNLIKYAKVSKNNDTIKVESFGVKFYENLEQTIKQIVEETYSFKIPISINLSGESYNKLEVFSLLSKKDMEGVIKTEFENICYTKEENPNAYEQKYIIADTGMVESEKIKIIHVSTTKANIAQKLNQFSQYKISNISPIGLTIQNLLKKDKKKTVSLIVDIEENTTVTKIYNNAVSDIYSIPLGMKDIIKNIITKENSYAKAYEVCKNITIYTDNAKDLEYEENEYLVEVMPVLYQIISEIKKITDESPETIEKVYITGSAAIINNIDIYFQEALINTQCEILKPNFIDNKSKLNIKDYIEVNSAISMGLQGIEKKNTVNFTNDSMLEKIITNLGEALNADVSNISFKGILEFADKFKKQSNTIISILTTLLLFYTIGSVFTNKLLEEKLTLANTSISNTNNRIAEIRSYTNDFNEGIEDYEGLIKKIENLNDINSEDKRFKNTIPNLLNNIMVVVPKSVQLVSIQNTSSAHIKITAKSAKYEQVAYFKAKLKSEGILKNVVSDTGTMQEGYVTVVIEGELP